MQLKCFKQLTFQEMRMEDELSDLDVSEGSEDLVTITGNYDCKPGVKY